MILLHDAIQALRPGKEFTMYDDNPDTIIWNDPKVTTPTTEQIQAKYEELVQAKTAEILAEKAAREAILTKLGLSEQEVTLLLKNL